MDNPAPVSAEQLNAAVAGLVAQRISRVRYFGLFYETTEPIDWDFGDWHWAEHGVEFTLSDGSSYSALWGDAFGHFDLELLPEPMGIRLHGVGERDGPRVWDVTDHGLWKPHVSQPVTDSKIVWMPGEPSDENQWEDRLAPIAVRLSFRTGDVWVVAAEPVDRPPTKRFWLGQNEVIVTFTPAFAAAIGLPVEP